MPFKDGEVEIRTLEETEDFPVEIGHGRFSRFHERRRGEYQGITITRISAPGRRPPSLPRCERLQFNDSAIFLEIARDDGGHAPRVFTKPRLV